MEKIVKTFNSVLKSIDEKSFSIIAVISNNKADRAREIVEPSAFKKRLKTFKDHPVLLSSHVSYSDLRKQIGEVEKITVEDGEVISKIKYYVGEGNDEADWAWNLAKKGIAAFSIGFISHVKELIDEKDQAKYGAYLRFTEIEMLELSQVLVPCNRGALQERAALNEYDKELCEAVIKSFDDKELVKINYQYNKKKSDEDEKKELFKQEILKELNEKIDSLIEEKMKSTKKEFINEAIQTFHNVKLYKAIIDGADGVGCKSDAEEDDTNDMNKVCDVISSIIKNHTKGK